MAKAHFKVRDEDLRGAYTSLLVASAGFESTTAISEDLRADVGHAGLGEKLVTFADEWAIARENLVKDMDALSANLQKILQMTDDFDNGTQEQQVDASGGSSSGSASPAAQQLTERYRAGGGTPAAASDLQGDPRQSLREQLQAPSTGAQGAGDARAELRQAVGGAAGDIR